MTSYEKELKLKLDLEWACTSYNEDSADELCYYLDESACAVGDTAYLYGKEDDELIKLEILNIIKRNDNIAYYDDLVLNNDVLIDGEQEYGADSSAEFITDNDSYLVWFKHVDFPVMSKEDIQAAIIGMLTQHDLTFGEMQQILYNTVDSLRNIVVPRTPTIKVSERS